MSRLKDLQDKYDVERVLRHLPGWAESGSRNFDKLEQSIEERWGEDDDVGGKGGDSPMMTVDEYQSSKLGQANAAGDEK
jgi:hypothetical protein